MIDVPRYGQGLLSLGKTHGSLFSTELNYNSAVCAKFLR